MEREGHTHHRRPCKKQRRDSMVCGCWVRGSLNGLELFLGFRVPQSVGENRFGNWLANARDWSISRNRYWGTPIPLWVSSDYEEVLLPST